MPSCATPTRTVRSRVEGTKVIDLPGGPLNHHWTKNILASRDGKKLYVTVGSNSNVGENGLDEEKDRAAIHELDLATGKMRLFASGLRNPNGLAWEPTTDVLWTVVNERDEIGNDLVPDYLTSVKDGGFYGWPYSYWGQHVDDAREGAKARSRRQGDQARLRPRRARRGAGAHFLRRRRCCPSSIAAARSSACTAPGTASRAAATK